MLLADGYSKMSLYAYYQHVLWNFGVDVLSG